MRNNRNSKNCIGIFERRNLFWHFNLVTESFRDFCKKEILTGENLYDAGDIHGLQVCVNNDHTILLDLMCLGSRKGRTISEISSRTLFASITFRIRLSSLSKSKN